MNLYILVGNIGTGKSTFVKHFLQEHPDVICVARDAIRYMIGGGNYVYSPMLEEAVFSIESNIIESFMLRKTPIIVDEVGISKSMRKSYIEQTKYWKYSTTALVMPRLDKQTCVNRRIAGDSRNTSKEVWENVWDKFDNQYEVPTLEEGFDYIQFIE